jgi:S-disulfanyl-L-cysteine oxidoreductase SoxD
VTTGLVPFGIIVLSALQPRHRPIARPYSPRSVWDSVYTDAQADRGDTVYHQTCSQCHGPALAGIDDAPALAGQDFLLDWIGKTVGQLAGRIQRTMPQDNSVALTPQQTADVVAYLLRYNKFPAGKVELSVDLSLVAGIRIDSVRPQPDQGRVRDSLRIGR